MTVVGEVTRVYFAADNPKREYTRIASLLQCDICGRQRAKRP